MKCLSKVSLIHTIELLHFFHRIVETNLQFEITFTRPIIMELYTESRKKGFVFVGQWNSDYNFVTV